MEDNMVDVVNAYEKAMTTRDFQEKDREGNDTVPAKFISWEIIETKADHTNVLTHSSRMSFKIILKTNQATCNSHHASLCG